MEAVIPEIISLFLLIGMGIVLKKKGAIDETMEKRLSEFTLYIVIPAMLIVSLYDMDALPDRSFWTKMLLMTCAAYLFTTVFAFTSMKFLRCGALEKKTLRFMMIFNNVANIAYPVLGATFGGEGILYATTFTLVFNVLLWTLGVAILNRDGERLSFKRFLSPALIAIIIGCAVSLSPVAMPHFLYLTLSKLSGMIQPLAMVIIGCALASLSILEVIGNRLIWRFVVIKQLALPAAFFLLIRLIVTDARAVGITTLMVAMPSAVNIVAFVKKHHADSALAAQAVVLTTIVSLPMVPVLLWFMGLFGI